MEYMSLVNLIYSRVFQQNSNYIALVPVADMCNYRYPCNTSWGFNQDGFYLKATEDIKRGEEIFLHYGYEGKSFSHYLYNYGYVPNFVDKNGVAAYTKVSDDAEHA
jgi:hypothetical protein